MACDAAVTLARASKFYRTRPRGVLAGVRKLAWHVAGAPGFGPGLFALRDVTLRVRAGESLALLGENGGGKSTLLKIVSGVTELTSGTVEVRGRIGSLIELGAGFHPDLTGLENLYLNGSLMGLRRRDMPPLIERVLDFAELGEFIHSPVRHYSMGMTLRLGFALAVCTDPQILIVDEALAVGDGYFQWKCLRRIREMQRAGVTLLFVSHVSDLAESLCERAVWLHRGMVRAQGSSREVGQRYADQTRAALAGAGPVAGDVSLAALLPMARIGTGEVVFENITLTDATGTPTRTVARGGTLRIVAEVFAREARRNVGVSTALQKRGQGLSIVYSHEHGQTFDIPAGRSRLCIEFANLPLYPETYYLSHSLYPDTDPGAFYDCHLKTQTFQVSLEDGAYYSPRLVALRPQIRVLSQGGGAAQ